MTLRVLTICLVAALVSFSLQIESLAQDDTATVTVGAWNIEWLGVPQNRSGVARNVSQTPKDISDYIALSGVDALALEEVSNDSTGSERTNSTIDAALALLNRDGAKWEYKLFPKKDQADRNQLTGVAWNKQHLSLEGDPVRLGVIDDNAEFNLWDRDPHAVKLQLVDGGNDFLLIPVHMKSNRGGAAKTSRQRQAEAAALVQQLSGIRSRFSDEDVVVLGDTNILKASEGANTLFTTAGFWDLNGNDAPTTFYGPAPFDRIYVVEDQPEFDGSFQVIVDSGFSPNEHKRRLSDHYMVTTTVTIMTADDDADR